MKIEFVYSLFLVGGGMGAVDFRSRRFAFRGGRIMKKLKCQLFQRTNSSWLVLSLLAAVGVCGVNWSLTWTIST
jgi:hypothetical protein